MQDNPFLNSVEPPLRIEPLRRTALFSVPAIALYAGLIAGTGGIYTSQNVRLLNDFVPKPVIEIRGESDSKRREPRLLSLRPALLKIRSSFGLTMTELASIFDVSRPTVYAWFNGASPRTDIVEKIWELRLFADSIESLTIKRIALIKRKPIVNGISLLEILKKGDSFGEATAALRATSETEADKTKALPRKRWKRRLTAEDVSITQHEPI